jgi:hypothetical protein
MRTRHLLLSVALIIGLFSAGRTMTIHAQVPDAKTVDALFKNAFLTGDLDAMFALFAPDAISTEPFGIFTSSAAAKAGLAAFLSQNPRLTASAGDSTVILDTAMHRVAVASDPIRAAGVSRIWLIHTMVVFQGKIIAFAAVPDLSDAETLKFAMAAAGQ